MSAISPGELTASLVIDSIETGAYSRDVVVTIARGFLPLAQEDLIGVLAYLSHSGDPEIASSARTSLGEMPTRAIFEFASNEAIDGSQLIRLVGATEDNVVLEALIRNRAVPDASIAELAQHADARLQEVIVINQARILRAPEILEALLANPALAPDVRRRALETKEEFFEKRARLQQLEEEEAAAPKEEQVADIPLDAIADLLEKAQEQKDAPAVIPLPDTERLDEKKTALWARLSFMTVAEKVQLAFRGDRMIRMMLVRDRNKLVCSGVMRNPRISEQEVEAIAGMRNVDEEVLRLIGVRRDWTSKYNIMHKLICNPKVPVGVVLPFINRLTLRDLKGLKDDKGVQQVVREMAKKFYLVKAQKS